MADNGSQKTKIKIETLIIMKKFLLLVQFVCYIAMAAILFGAWPVLMGDPGKVSPEDWQKARIWCAILPFVFLAVSLGARHLSKKK